MIQWFYKINILYVETLTNYELHGPWWTLPISSVDFEYFDIESIRNDDELAAEAKALESEVPNLDTFVPNLNPSFLGELMIALD